MNEYIKITDGFGEYEYTSEELIEMAKVNKGFFNNLEILDYNEELFEKLIQLDLDFVKNKKFSESYFGEKLLINSIREDMYEQFSDEMKIDMLVYSNNSNLKTEIDESIILKAIEKNPYVIKKIDEEFMKDEDFVKKAISINKEVFKVGFKEFKNNPEISNFALKCDGELLEYYLKSNERPTAENIKNAVLETYKSTQYLNRSVPQELEEIIYIEDEEITNIQNPSAYIKNLSESYEMENDQLLVEYCDFNKRHNAIEVLKIQLETRIEIENGMTNPDEKVIKDCEKLLDEKVWVWTEQLNRDLSNSEYLNKESFYKSLELSRELGNAIGFEDRSELSKNNTQEEVKDKPRKTAKEALEKIRSVKTSADTEKEKKETDSSSHTRR